MSLSDALRPALCDRPIPPPAIGGFAAAGLAKPDAPESLIDAGGGEEQIEGATFAIEYCDVKGARTRRRVSLFREAVREPPGHLRCFCHERKAWRTFRLDRVEAVIDLDGTVHEDVRRFFREEMGLVVAEASALPAARTALPDPRTLVRPGAVLLAAMGRSDGRLVAVELGVAGRYARRRAEMAGAVLDEDAGRRLQGWVKRLYPVQDQVDWALGRIDAEPPEGLRLFLGSLVELIQADGKIAPQETALLRRVASGLQLGLGG